MKTVLLYGNSIFLAGLAAQLRGRSDLRVRQQADLTGLIDLGDLGDLEAVVVDLDAAAYPNVLALLRARPDLCVVGVNAATSAVTVLHGQVYLAQSVEEVTRTIYDF